MTIWPQNLYWTTHSWYIFKLFCPLGETLATLPHGGRAGVIKIRGRGSRARKEPLRSAVPLKWRAHPTSGVQLCHYTPHKWTIVTPKQQQSPKKKLNLSRRKIFTEWWQLAKLAGRRVKTLTVGDAIQNWELYNGVLFQEERHEAVCVQRF